MVAEYRKPLLAERAKPGMGLCSVSIPIASFQEPGCEKRPGAKSFRHAETSGTSRATPITKATKAAAEHPQEPVFSSFGLYGLRLFRREREMHFPEVRDLRQATGSEVLRANLSGGYVPRQVGDIECAECRAVAHNERCHRSGTVFVSRRLEQPRRDGRQRYQRAHIHARDLPHLGFVV